MKYFLIGNGTFLVILGLAVFYYYQKRNIFVARIGIMIFIIGGAQIFWYLFWGAP